MDVAKKITTHNKYLSINVEKNIFFIGELIYGFKIQNNTFYRVLIDSVILLRKTNRILFSLFKAQVKEIFFPFLLKHNKVCFILLHFFSFYHDERIIMIFNQCWCCFPRNSHSLFTHSLSLLEEKVVLLYL